MQIPKSNQLAYRNKHRKPFVYMKEDVLQLQANDYLELKRIRYIRIPDTIWRWIAYKATEAVKIWFRKIFGGIPDNICILPINKNYNLCLALELKTAAGQLHGKQKHWSKDLSVQISRSPEDTMRIIDKFIAEAERMKDDEYTNRRM